MNTEIFADGISGIHVTGNLVRIDFMSVQPHLKSDNGQPVIEVNKRIIMPLEGFIQSVATHENIVKQLIEAGVLKQNAVVQEENPETVKEETPEPMQEETPEQETEK